MHLKFLHVNNIFGIHLYENMNAITLRGKDSRAFRNNIMQTNARIHLVAGFRYQYNCIKRLESQSLCTGMVNYFLINTKLVIGIINTNVGEFSILGI